jgi:hypothetical protein
MKHAVLYYFLTLSLAFQIHALPVQEPQLGLAIRDASSVSLTVGRALNVRGLKQVVNKLTGKDTPRIPNQVASSVAPVQRLISTHVPQDIDSNPRVTLPPQGAGRQTPSPTGSQNPPPADEAPAHPPGLAVPSNANAGPSNANAGPSNANAGPSNAIAGPSNANAGPSNAIAGPSNPKAS